MNLQAALALGLPIGIGIAAVGSGIGLGLIGQGAMQAIGPEACGPELTYTRKFGR